MAGMSRVCLYLGLLTLGAGLHSLLAGRPEPEAAVPPPPVVIYRPAPTSAAVATAPGTWGASYFSYPMSKQFPKCNTVMGNQKASVEHVCGLMHEVIDDRWEVAHLSEIDALPPEGSKCMVTFGEWRGPIATYWVATKKNNKIVAFEPDPLSFSRLATNLLSYGIVPLNMCVNVDGESLNTEMYDASGSRVVKETGKHLFNVKCVAYDTLFSLYPDCFYKIDIEGYEHLLIDKLLLRPPPFLSLSVHNMTMYLPDQPAFFAKLEQLAAKYDYAKDLQPFAGDNRFYEWFFKARKHSA